MLFRSATLQFGMVNIPVAITSVAKRKDHTFRTLHVSCGTPVKQQYQCVTCHTTELETVKGFEFSKGEFVMFTQDEIDSVKSPRAKTIRLSKFVEHTDISPLLIEKSYALNPAVEPKSYLLLRTALERSGRVAIGKSSLWGRESACAVTVHDGLLYLLVLFSFDELQQQKHVADCVFTEQELVLSDMIVASMSGVIDQTDLSCDTYARVQALIDQKLGGVTCHSDVSDPVDDRFDDLLSALQASIPQTEVRDAVSA